MSAALDSYALLERFERGEIPAHEVPSALLSWFNAGYRSAADAADQRALDTDVDLIGQRLAALDRVDTLLASLPERSPL